MSGLRGELRPAQQVRSVTESRNWDALAKAVVARRVALGYQQQKALAARMGMSGKILGEIENARRRSYRRSTLDMLEQTLLWKYGSVDAILAGGEPVKLPLPAPSSGPLAEMGNAELIAQLGQIIAQLGQVTAELSRRLPDATPPNNTTRD